MPLPPLETALVCVWEKQSWYLSLRLLSQLFALKGPRFVEFGCHSRGKHEGRREAVCLLYKSLHGHPSPLLQHYFSSLPAPSPSPDPGCGHRCIDVSGGEGAAAGASANMYGELQRLISKAVRTHVAYDGVVECRFSFITGITCRYVHTPSRNDELVELFSAPLTREEWLPLQLLRALMSCAARLYSPGELERELMRSAATWPSLFMDAAQNERLFCTTFLRRYLGLRVMNQTMSRNAQEFQALYISWKVRGAPGERDRTCTTRRRLIPARQFFLKVWPQAQAHQRLGPGSACGLMCLVTLRTSGRPEEQHKPASTRP
ncbi:hypothetical protein ERJ75_001164000 [Trypanosoma vivax]|nr:hypothetical protein ERJ75_001164000 [Trypanosoma vivax]